MWIFTKISVRLPSGLEIALSESAGELDLELLRLPIRGESRPVELELPTLSL